MSLVASLGGLAALHGSRLEHATLARFARTADADDVLDLYHRSAEPGFAATLFQAAAQLRDRHLGTAPWWSAGVSAITPCELEPLCTYCNFFTTKATPAADIVAAVRAIAGLGIRHVHLSGGSRLPRGERARGLGPQVIDLVTAIRKAVDIEIEVNVGPSLMREDVRDLKDLGVTAITSSLEVLNARLFEQLKPGDSLQGRLQLMEFCEEAGMPIRSMMMVGIGETDQDRIDHLVYLRRYTMMKQLRLSRYMPIRNTAAGGVRCAPWLVARLTAIARLLYPTLEIGLAAGNGTDDLPLWWMAGGGNQVLGAGASMKGRAHKSGDVDEIPVNDRVGVHNNMPGVTRVLGEMGLRATFSSPPSSVRKS